MKEVLQVVETPEIPRSPEELAIENALVPLKSFRDILAACEDADTLVSPIVVGVVLEVLFRTLRGALSVCGDATMR